MNEHTAEARLAARLAELHDAALVSGEPQIRAYRESWRRRWHLAQRARRAAANGPIDSLASRDWRLLFARRWLVVALAGAILVLIVVVYVAGGSARRVPIATEPLHARQPQVPTPAASSSRPAALRDPCQVSNRGDGSHPEIDDFEDGNPLIEAAEGRFGVWSMFKDSDTPGNFEALTPTRLPNATRRNRYALHVSGGELLDWGASIQFDLRPSCYDAGAYSGLSFRAKGPGRVYVGVRQISVVPVEYGGTCTKDCYNVHQKKVDLSARWETYTVAFSDMRQRGYGTPQLDASRINGVGFLVQPADTPYDFWIDDVKFVPR